MSKFVELLGILLFPLSLLHLGVIKIRHFCYDRGFFKSWAADLPVISVGNIQIGGTGKTPLVEIIAEILRENKFRPVIISRGYGRKNKNPMIIDVLNRDSVTARQIGDEPMQYLQNIPDIILGIDGDRRRMARQIQDQYPDAVIILDDGLQHRKIKRDVEIIALDGDRWTGSPLLFPFTAFRDSRNALAWADMLFFAGNRQRELAERLAAKHDLPHFFSEIIPWQLSSVDEEYQLKPAILNGLKIAAISAIARPQKFYETLNSLNAEIVYRKSFRDHHSYSEEDLAREKEKAKRAGAELLVTTQKDAVKFAAFDAAVLKDVYVLKIKLEIQNRAEFAQMLLQKLKIFQEAPVNFSEK